MNNQLKVLGTEHIGKITFTGIEGGFGPGKKALDFKLKYIQAFNKMEQQIRNQSERPKLMQKERIEVSRQNAETRKASLLYRVANL